jgi:hypothetical protein
MSSFNFLWLGVISWQNFNQFWRDQMVLCITWSPKQMMAGNHQCENMTPVLPSPSEPSTEAEPIVKGDFLSRPFGMLEWIEMQSLSKKDRLVPIAVANSYQHCSMKNRGTKAYQYSTQYVKFQPSKPITARKNRFSSF